MKKYLSKFNNIEEYNDFLNSIDCPSVNVSYIDEDDLVKYYKDDIELHNYNATIPFWFEVTERQNQERFDNFYINLGGDNAELKIGENDWQSYPTGVLQFELRPNTRVYVRTSGWLNDNTLQTFGYDDNDAKIKIGGNIMSLFGGEFKEGYKQDLHDMFNGVIQITDARELYLPKRELPRQVFLNMFKDCTNLEYGPNILAPGIPYDGCNSMFYGCTSLKKTPIMLFKFVEFAGCFCMFQNCTGLEFAYPLFINKVGNYALDNMFNGCSSLEVGPYWEGTIKTTEGLDHIIESMFANCSALKILPFDITITTGNYSINDVGSWFCLGCTNLVISPHIKFDINGNFGTNIFGDCSSLKEIWIEKLRNCDGDLGIDTSTTRNYVTPLPDIDYGYINNNYIETDWQNGEQLQFVALDDGNISYNGSGLEYSIDEGSTFNTYEANTVIHLNKGDRILWGGTKAVTGKFITVHDDTHTKFIIRGAINSINQNNNVAYDGLFQACDILDAHLLYLTSPSINQGAYARLFKDCTLLADGPQSVDSGQNWCNEMFKNCTNLVVAPQLPATTLADYCYQSMFSGCSNLIVAPELPATTLASGCYAGMFNGCTSLINAPQLPAVNLTDGCYGSMFNGCTNLLYAPNLNGAAMVNSCYNNMFNGCTNLMYLMCLSISPNSDYSTDWLSGTRSTGTFKKAPGVTWTRGVSGIPEGWTVK